MIRWLLACAVALSLAACSQNGASQLAKLVEPLGNFKLGHAEVAAPKPVKGPLSRDASNEEWATMMDDALETRFRRYQGDKFYHLGVSVDGYVLAQPGIPLVLSPKSVLIVRVTVWDDATQSKLNEEAFQVTALEQLSGETLLGSGLTQSKETQMKNLTANAALLIEQWMRKNQKEQGWFGGIEANATTSARLAAEASGTEVVAPAQ